MQLETVLSEFYTYVLNEIFFKKQCIFKAFDQKPCIMRLHLCNKRYFYFYCLCSSLLGNWDLWAIGTLGQLGLSSKWAIWKLGPLGNWDIIVKITKNYTITVLHLISTNQPLEFVLDVKMIY